MAIVTRLKHLPGLQTNALPHEQTKLTVPYNFLENVRGSLLASLKRHVGFVVAEVEDSRTDVKEILESGGQARANLPALFLRWRELQSGQPDVPTRPLKTETTAGTMLFTPRYEGVTTSTDPGYLVDSTADFSNIRTEVRVGDFAAVVNDNGDGTVDVLQQTTVTAVDFPNNRVQVAADLFPIGTSYEIHNPIDIKRTFKTSRYVDATLLIYADPDAPDGDATSLNYVERLTRGWLESDIARIVLGQLGTQLVREHVFRQLLAADRGFRVTNESGPLGDTIDTYMAQAQVEVPLLVEEVTEMPWPCLGSIGVGADIVDTIDTDQPATVHQDSEISRDREQTT